MDVPTVRRSGDVESAASQEQQTPSAIGAPRDERAAAQVRYDAFACAAHPDENPSWHCADVRDPQHDFDRCSPDPVRNPVLYARQATDADLVDSHDVQQGAVGDCFFLAALSALARSPEGRALIQNAIRENRNDRGDVVSYTVTLHRPQTHFFGFGRTTFTDVQVTVDGHYACGHALAPQTGNAHEVWAPVMEQAYAQLCRGYNAIARGGVPSDAMEVLTGRPAKHIELGWYGRYSADELIRDLAASKMIVLGTRGDVQGYGLAAHHAYVVTGAVERDGELYICLDNLWGTEQQPVPVSALSRCFRGVNVGCAK
jgi:hypothetical protein